MILKFIKLKNFRLHIDTKIDFSKNINYIIGGNGQGKTSLLEAIYYLCTTKNMNQVSDIEALNFTENYFEIVGEFSSYSNNKIRVFFDRNTNKKTIFINDKQVNKNSSVIGKFPVVALLQSDHAITQGSPAERRRFVDSIISQSSATYLKFLLDYNRILRHRSSLLSKLKEFNSKELYDQLDVWTYSLVKTGTEIIKHRKEFIETFNNYILKPYENILGTKEIPKIIYKPFEYTDTDDIKNIFMETIKKKEKEELKRARNLVGPHRDDFQFFINDLSLKKYGSQGQHKTFQIALRFSQFFYLLDKLNETPVFLMDDVFGELDLFRVEKISNYLNKIGQAFITLTDFSNIEKLNIAQNNNLLLKIKNGKVVNA